MVVRDQGRPSWFETLRFLTIHLIDINENKPEFAETTNPYKFVVLENSPKDIRIGKIQATIKDKNSKATIFYYILLGNENSAFYLDKTSGDIYTNQSLDRELVDSYQLYVLASKQSDLHISELERSALSLKALDKDHTVAKIQITVLDVNDNAPVFEKEVSQIINKTYYCY